MPRAWDRNFGRDCRRLEGKFGDAPPMGRPKHGQHGENRKTHRAVWGCGRVVTDSPAGRSCLIGVEATHRWPLAWKVLGEGGGSQEKVLQGAERQGGCLGHFWATGRDRARNSLRRTWPHDKFPFSWSWFAGSAQNVEGILCTPCSLSRSFIPPQINVQMSSQTWDSSSRPCRSSVRKATHTPDISLPSPLQCLPITSSQLNLSFKACQSLAPTNFSSCSLEQSFDSERRGVSMT